MRRRDHSGNAVVTTIPVNKERISVKKLWSMLILAALLTTGLTACGGESSQETGSGTGVLAGFTAQDLEGNDVDDSIFDDYDVTMINVWGTFCGPCIQEMPDLGEISDEYADKGIRVRRRLPQDDAASHGIGTGVTGQFALGLLFLYSSRICQNSSSVLTNFVSPVFRSTVTKYSQSPGSGLTAALMALSPGLPMGVGGRPKVCPLCRLYGF